MLDHGTSDSQMLSLPWGELGMISGRVLVTGGTGFVGGHLIRRLQGEGVDLRCLVRDRRRAASLGVPPATHREGSLEDPPSLEAAVGGVDVVVHLAGAITAVRTRDYFRSNADGTRNLVGAIARCAPAASVVYVSSLAAAGPSADGTGTDLQPDRCKPCSHYGESKRQGELAVIDAQRWVILRPPMVYGPSDRATRLLFRSALATVTPVPWADRPISLVHVRDLIQAISVAGRGIAEHRILPIDGPDRLSFHGLPRAMAEVCGQSSRLLPLPVLGLRGAAVVADAVALLRRRASFFSLDKVREIAAVGWVADPGPARDALGFQPQIPTSQGLAETARAEGFTRREPETPA